MSLLVEITGKQMQAPHFLRSRSLHTCVGEDAHGVITLDRPYKPYFSVFIREPDALLRAETDGLLYDGRSLHYMESRCLNDGSTIECGEKSITLYRCSSTAEACAHAEIPPDAVPAIAAADPTLSVTWGVGHLHACLALIPELPVTVGSHPEAGLFIDIAGVEAFHCELTASRPHEDGNSVGFVATPLQGRCRCGSVGVSNETLLSAPCDLVLEPAGITLAVAVYG